MNRIPGKLDRRACIALLAFVPFVFTGQTLAQSSGSSWDSLEGVGGVGDLFRKLSAGYDRYVASEKRDQLWRSVERLRVKLYLLELDATALREVLPDRAPDAVEREDIRSRLRPLRNTLERLTADLRAVGAELRLQDPDEVVRVEQRLLWGIKARGTALGYVEGELQRTSQNPSSWDATEMRAQMTKGIDAVKDAQRAAVQFQGQLRA